MDGGSDENTNFLVVHITQTKGSIKYVQNTYGDSMQTKK